MRLRGTAPSRRISRAGALTAAVLAVGGLLAGCGGSSSPTATTATTSKAGADAANDAQILNALTLNAQSLDAVYQPSATSPGVTWSPWGPLTAADNDAIGMTALKVCEADMDFSDQARAKPTQTVEGYFKGTVTGGGTKWVRTITAVYNTAADASTALKGFGDYAGEPDKCGGQTVTTPKPFVRGVSVTQPSWYVPAAFSPPTVIVVDVARKVALSAVAQIRGRFIVFTYTTGDYSVDQNNTYYALKASSDTITVASAATSALSQLTDAVVNNN